MVEIQGGHNDIPYRNDVDILKARASNYMNYGSYSGADIKVIVHFPKDKAMQQLLFEQKAKLEKELFNLDNEITNFFPEVPSISAALYDQSQLQSSREALTGELDIVNKDINSLKNMPTSKVIAELQTISYSVFREKSPVRTLGSVYPRAYVRGPRTIGGSMIFTVFHQHVLHEILKLNLNFFNTGTSDHDKYSYTSNLPDQMPPLDLSLVFANEYGAISHMGLYGVEFVQEGSTFSIEDIFSENTVQYVARDMDPMKLVTKRERNAQGIKKEWTKTASLLLKEQQYTNNHLLRRN